MSVKATEDLGFILARIKEFGGIKRLGITFETLRSGYFYDNGTGKVLCCEPDEFRFFEWLFTDTHDYSLGRVVTRRKAKLLRNGFEQRPRRILHFWHSA